MKELIETVLTESAVRNTDAMEALAIMQTEFLTWS